jgi:hypothetical protein
VTSVKTFSSSEHEQRSVTTRVTHECKYDLLFRKIPSMSMNKHRAKHRNNTVHRHIVKHGHVNQCYTNAEHKHSAQMHETITQMPQKHCTITAQTQQVKTSREYKTPAAGGHKVYTKVASCEIPELPQGEVLTTGPHLPKLLLIELLASTRWSFAPPSQKQRFSTRICQKIFKTNLRCYSRQTLESTIASLALLRETVIQISVLLLFVVIVGTVLNRKMLCNPTNAA